MIVATVRSAFAQGCERVYLVDNDNPDDTVTAAVGAGAILAERFSTPFHHNETRFEVMNRTVARVSEAEESEHIWWLWTDADEFHHAPGGLTVREYLATLDGRFRIVGARVLNHVPDRRPAYLPGFHPIEFQPLCYERADVPMCEAGHWKHPLQRFDRGRPPIVCGSGIHKARSAERPLYEPVQPIFLHHFQYRDEGITRARLERLCHADGERARRIADPGRDGGPAMVKRFATLDALYAQRWHEVDSLRVTGRALGISPLPWPEVVRPHAVRHHRWYTPDDLERAHAGWQHRHARESATVTEAL